MTAFAIVVAVDTRSGIGKDGDLPWRLPGDQKHFKALTTETRDPAKRNAVIMGRKTWESLPDRFRPLPGRLNVVLTRQEGYALPAGVRAASGVTEALESIAADVAGVESVFIIGGKSLYRDALALPVCEQLHITRVEGDFKCDTFFDDPGDNFVLESTSESLCENGIRYQFEVYCRRS